MEGLTIAAGVDRIVDVTTTSVNVCPDLMHSVRIANSEKEPSTTLNSLY